MLQLEAVDAVLAGGLKSCEVRVQSAELVALKRHNQMICDVSEAIQARKLGSIHGDKCRPSWAMFGRYSNLGRAITTIAASPSAVGLIARNIHPRKAAPG